MSNIDRPGINEEPFTIYLEEDWFNGYKTLLQIMQKDSMDYYDQFTVEDFEESVKELKKQGVGKPMVVGMGAVSALSLECQLRKYATGNDPSKEDIEKMKEYFEEGYFYTFNTMEGWSKEKLNYL